MEKMPQILKDIKARPDAEITFGYVMADGTYVQVRGIMLTYRGSRERGITGIKVRYTGQHANHFLKWQDETGHIYVPFNLAGIERGEKIRADRVADQRRAERAAYRAANPATAKQISYLNRLYGEAGQQTPTALDRLSKVEASQRISELEDKASPARAARRRCRECGQPITRYGDLDGLRGEQGYCHDCV